MPREKENNKARQKQNMFENPKDLNTDLQQQETRNAQSLTMSPAARELSFGTLALYGAFAPYALLRDWSHQDFY